MIGVAEQLETMNGAVVKFARIDGVISERSGDRVVVLDAQGAAIITLSPVGSLIWDSLPCSEDDAVVSLAARFPDVAESVLRTDVDAFLAELLANSLIMEIDASG